MANLVNLNWLEDIPLSMSLRYFQTGFTKVGRPTLGTGGTIPLSGVLDYGEGKPELSTSIPLSFLSAYVNSFLPLLPPRFL